MPLTGEEVQKAIEQKTQMMDDIIIGQQAKNEIAATAMIMECCLVMAKDIVERRYNVSDEADIQEVAFKMFEGITRKATPAPPPGGQQVITLDPRMIRNAH